MFVSPIATLSIKKNNTLAEGNQGLNSKVQYFPKESLAKPSFENIQAYHSNVINFKGKTLELGKFKDLAANELHPMWQKLIARENEFSPNPDDVRGVFKVDYDWILHSGAYNRTAAKTQVFSFPSSDMTTTRIHHINQVAAVAEDISEALGLNTKLTRAIALGHDIGHAPFGHAGERRLNMLIQKHNIKTEYWKDGFYHEKNSMRFADDIETELDANGNAKNLNLTYAVRDGIISHCGEVDENGIKPRAEYVDLRSIGKNNRPQPYTWEACVVKVSDKIAYVGKDIEDAMNNKFLHPDKLNILRQMIKESTGEEFKEINNTVLMNRFVSDLVKNSSPEDGLKFSQKTQILLDTVKKFNYEHIYLPKDAFQAPYCDNLFNSVFDSLNGLYDGKNTLAKVSQIQEKQPTMSRVFKNWLVKYSNIAPEEKSKLKLTNKTLYDIESHDDYKLAVIEFMSGMTDKFMNNVYQEIIKFG